MSSHSNVSDHLGRKGITFSEATAGCTTVSAANNTLDAKDLSELERVAGVSGYEVILNAGAIKIRPRNSNL